MFIFALKIVWPVKMNIRSIQSEMGSALKLKFGYSNDIQSRAMIWEVRQTYTDFFYKCIG